MKKNLKSLKLSMPDSEKYFEVVNGVNGERERERERETCKPDSSWMGDRLGTPGAVGFFQINLFF